MNSEKPESTTSESRSQANKLYSKKLKSGLRNSENKQFWEKRMQKNGKSRKLDKKSKTTGMQVNAKTNIKNCWFNLKHLLNSRLIKLLIDNDDVAGRGGPCHHTHESVSSGLFP